MDRCVKLFNPEILKQMGVCPFDKNKKTGLTFYLYPGEWFNNIPKGYKVLCIDGREYLWDKKTCDDDIRYGCLSYGFLK
jgi:hypothetical protein